MLTHNRDSWESGDRVVLIGASGFLGRRLQHDLGAAGVGVTALGSAEVDLAADDAADRLAGTWGEGDAVVFLSAITPDRGRGVDVFMANLRMARAVCTAVEALPPRHLVYLSSDAVYPFGDGPVSEISPPSAGDLYGAMHWAREVMLGSVAGERLAVLRSTMLYGAGDPHNSYGPNRLRRMGRDNGEITLFGAGEETRDHVNVDDAARLVSRVLARGSTGILNLACGQSVSYDELARSVARRFDTAVPVVHTPRANPITHRHFDITALRRAFPDFAFTELEAGLDTAHAEMTAGRDA